MIFKKSLFLVVISTIIQVCLSETDYYPNRKFLFIQQDQNPAVAQQPAAAQAPAQAPAQANQQQPAQQNNPQQGAANQQPNQQQLGQDGKPLPPPKEKDLLLVIPFTKEQFEREMKLQSEKLQKESKYYNKINLDTLKNITIENKKIIDQKKELIKLYLNHTTSSINDLANVLQRELEQNHETMLNLAQAIIMQTLDNYEKEISKVKVKIQELLVKVVPPTTICKKIKGCQSCVHQMDCIWSPDRRACFVGKIINYFIDLSYNSIGLGFLNFFFGI